MQKIKRKIVKIDEDRCNGCGLCVPGCKEGALKIIAGKAKLVGDTYCDGLGACLGHCPQGAITIEDREADEFDERVMPQSEKLPCGCPGTMAKSFGKNIENHSEKGQSSELTNWPVKLKLVPVDAPYLKDADIVLLADCAAVAYANLHRDFIKNRIVLMGCPKLDDIDFYYEKLKQMMEINRFRSMEVVMMEVPCCAGLGQMVDRAASEVKNKQRLFKTIVNIDGEK